MAIKISLITVCYNSEKTIEETLKSVQNQTYNNIEYIVIDGDSKDATISIITKYHDIISHFTSEPDKGLYDAINKGIQKATGDYVGILNSDDVFFENQTLSKIVAYLNENPHLDAITGDIVQTKNNRVIRKYSSSNWNPQKLKRGFMPPHPSIFIRTHLFQELGLYRLDYRIGADYELIVRYFLKERISYQYSGIITTSMAIGGASSSGYKSYKIITQEIKKAFNQNNIRYSPLQVRFRFFWKILGYISKK